MWVGTAQSIWRLATGWTVRGSKAIACWGCGFESRRGYGCLCCKYRQKAKCRTIKTKTQVRLKYSVQENTKKKSRWVQIFPHASRPALGPTQPLSNACRVSFPGVKLPGRGVNHPPYIALRLNKE